MARRKRKQRENPSAKGDGPVAAKGASAKPQAAEGRQLTPPPEEDVNRTIHRIVLGTILAVFVIFEVSVIALFSSGEQIKWKRELSEIESTYAEGNHEEAAAELEEFGQRWPGARETSSWNEKMGRYLAQTGQWEEAAGYFEQASELDPEAPELRARAGEAYWKAGQKQNAVEMLEAELSEVDPSIGDHDRANYYLGLALMEEEKYPEAFQHFQAVSDREQWQDGLARVYERIEQELLAPAREVAQENDVSELISQN